MKDRVGRSVIQADPPLLFSFALMRRAFRFIAARVNPYVQRLVGRGWLPFVGIVLHRGRHSGKSYATPVVAGMTGGWFMIPMTLGSHSNWFRNVVEAGDGTVVWKGREYRTTRPVVVPHRAARSAFPWPLWLLIRTLAIGRFLSLQHVDSNHAHAGAVRPALSQ